MCIAEATSGCPSSPVVVVPAGGAGDGAAAHEDHLVGQLDGRRHPVERLRTLLHAYLKPSKDNGY